MFRITCFQSVTGALALLLAGCASQSPAPNAPNAPNAPSAPTANAAEDSRAALACLLPTNCVSSFNGGSLAPLRFEGTQAQALTLLRATLAEFPEAQIVRADGLSLEAVFTTSAGFRDLVDFRIDAQAQRIDYRSRSSFGLFDLGKNRSRMTAFSARFEQIAKR
jgi:uncharacterized protein (DUF1499 family)